MLAVSSNTKKFALIGAAGYVAPLHLRAIKETQNQLVAAFDPHDSVGIMDSYFPSADFFTEFERFDRHIHKLSRANPPQTVDYISICSPNYLHDSHVRFTLRSNADAICEKPIVLNSWNIDALLDLEKETGRKVYTVLQLRLHPAIQALKKKVEREFTGDKYEVELSYVSARGHWYFNSWKGDEKKSGGIAANIGIHFFDMLHYVFGNVKENIVHFRNQYKAAGYLEYEKAKVKWFLSLDADDLPAASKEKEVRTFRSIKVNDEVIDFSGGFEGLHTKLYEAVLAGSGFRLEENRAGVEVTGEIRTMEIKKTTGEVHPLLKQ